jgi:hypothetical protein
VVRFLPKDLHSDNPQRFAVVITTAQIDNGRSGYVNS